MPGQAGRKPNEGQPVRHSVKPVHDWTEIEDVPFRRAPGLPKAEQWPAPTRAWWKAVSTMPHCTLWGEADWEYALETARVARAWHLTAKSGYATELRLRERVIGVGWLARRDLRIRYVAKAAKGQGAGVTSIDDFRRQTGLA